MPGVNISTLSRKYRCGIGLTLFGKVEHFGIPGRRPGISKFLERQKEKKKGKKRKERKRKEKKGGKRKKRKRGKKKGKGGKMENKIEGMR